jgi:hypothetical protein
MPVTGHSHEAVNRFVDECFVPMLAQEFLRWREIQRLLSADGHPENLTTEPLCEVGGL